MPREWLPEGQDTQAEKRWLKIEAWAIGILMALVLPSLLMHLG